MLMSGAREWTPSQLLFQQFLGRGEVDTRSIRVPLWFVMQRKGGQASPPQLASLLSSGRGATTRVRVALWTIFEGSTAATHGRGSELTALPSELAATVIGARPRDLEQLKVAKRAVGRAYKVLDEVGMIYAVPGTRRRLALRPGRGPHEAEPWTSSMRGGGYEDPAIEVPVSWFWHGWVDHLSGRGLAVLLSLLALGVEPDGRHYALPRVRAQRLRIGPTTWRAGVDELRSHRIVAVGRTRRPAEGAVGGDSRTYRLDLSKMTSTPGRARTGLLAADEPARDVAHLSATRASPKGWKPVLYVPDYIFLGIRRLEIYDLRRHVDVHVGRSPVPQLRVDPDLVGGLPGVAKVLQSCVRLSGGHLHHDQIELVEQLLPEPRPFSVSDCAQVLAAAAPWAAPSGPVLPVGLMDPPPNPGVPVLPAGPTEPVSVPGRPVLPSGPVVPHTLDDLMSEERASPDEADNPFI